MSSTGKPRGIEGIRILKPRSFQAAHRRHNDSYLDLYMLHKEKERLEKELVQLEKRREGISKRLETIESKMRELKESALEGDEEKGKEIAGRKTPGKGWKRMSIDY